MGLAVVGCKRKSAEKCEEALQTTRQAVAAEDFDVARQWREYAYKQCEDTGMLAQLDQEIVTKQGAVQARQVAEQTQKSETDQVVKALVRLASEKRGQIQTAAANLQCEEKEGAKGKAAEERWCAGTRSVGDKYTISVRYWDADKEAFRFVTRPPNPVSCSDLGDHNVVRTWQVAATEGRSATRTHCEFTGGPLAGLHGLVSQAHNADVHVFSPKYLEHDLAMRQMVQGG
jgi:hypothetical protein